MLNLTTLSAGLCCAVLSYAPADDAEQAFDRFYGAKVRAAQTTSSPDDDVALAKELLTTAKGLSGDQGLLPHFLLNAYTLGQKSSDGYSTAVAAMRLLAQKSPDHSAEARDNIVKLLRVAYAGSRGDDRKTYGAKLVVALVEAGDAQLRDGKGAEAVRQYRMAFSTARTVRLDDTDGIKSKLDYATQVVKLERRLTLLKNKLEGNPNDRAAADELVTAYVVQLNNPAEAAKYAFAADPALKRNVALAVQPIGGLNAQESLLLGKWYASFADGETGPAKVAMLDRAVRCYQRFLLVDTSKNLDRTTAELQVKRLEAELSKLGKTASPLVDVGGHWRSLFHSKTQLLRTSPGLPKPSRGEAKYEDGVLTLKDFAEYRFPVDAANLLVRAKVTPGMGNANITLRNSATGKYIFRLYGTGRFAIYRTFEGKGQEIAAGNAPHKLDEQVVWMVGALGDNLVVWADGKPVIRVQDDKVAQKGAVTLYALGGAEASFEAAAFMLPSKSQARQLLESASIN